MNKFLLTNLFCFLFYLGVQAQFTLLPVNVPPQCTVPFIFTPASTGSTSTPFLVSFSPDNTPLSTGVTDNLDGSLTIHSFEPFSITMSDGVTESAMTYDFTSVISINDAAFVSLACNRIYCPSISGGTEPYITTLTQIYGQQAAPPILTGPNCFSVQGSGGYILNVVDANGCTATWNVDLTTCVGAFDGVSTVQSLDWSSATNQGCLDIGCESLSMITVNSGPAGSYSVGTVLGIETACFPAPSPGDYNLTLTNVAGCAITINATLVDNAICEDFDPTQFEIHPMFHISVATGNGFVEPFLMGGNSVQFDNVNATIYNGSICTCNEVFNQDNSTGTSFFPWYDCTDGEVMNICLTLSNSSTGCSTRRCTTVVSPVPRLAPQTGAEISFEEAELSLFPNPAHEEINIQMESLEEESEASNISIYDISGKLVMELNNVAPMQLLAGYKISTLDFDDGFYVVKITQGTKSKQQKFIVSK